MRILHCIGSLALAAGCMSHAAPLQTDTAAVYTAVIAGSYHAVPGTRLAVLDRTIAIPPVGEWAARKFKAASTPSALAGAARRVPKAPQPLDASLLPAGTRVVPRSRVDAIFAAAGANAWPDFQREFGVVGWIALSPVAFTTDRLDALVYYEAHCGGLCGEGGYAWVRRKDASAPWRLAETFTTWVS